MTYDVSKLNKRVHFYNYDGQTDGAGGKIDNWQTKEGYKKIFSRWADVIILSGKSLYQAKMMQEETTHDIVIRYSNKLAEMKPSLIVIEYRGKRLDVNYVIDIQNKHEFLKLRCTENYGNNRR